MTTVPLSLRLITACCLTLQLWSSSIKTVTGFSALPHSIHTTINTPARCSNVREFPIFQLMQRLRRVDGQFEDQSLHNQPACDLKENSDRRTFIASNLMIMAIATSMSTQSDAVSTTKLNQTTNIISSDNISQKISGILHAIPTFTIVDRRGVPFMVVGDDAKLTTYFFSTFDEASRILSLASTSTDRTLLDLEKEINAKRKSDGKMPLNRNEREVEVGVNLWKEARISTVPLDFAVKLASRGQVGGSYFRVAPAEEDVQDALNIDKTKSELKEGKVPLFYYEDFEISTKEGGQSQIPLYFQKKQLIKDWAKINSKKGGGVPEVKVTELFSVIQSMAAVDSPSGGSDEDIERLVLVPPPGSVGKATACLKRGGNEAPFILGERIVVL